MKRQETMTRVTTARWTPRGSHEWKKNGKSNSVKANNKKSIDVSHCLVMSLVIYTQCLIQPNIALVDHPWVMTSTQPTRVLTISYTQVDDGSLVHT